MASIPVNSSTGRIVGLKVVPTPDRSGEFIPVIHVENIDIATGPQGEAGPQGLPGPQGTQGVPGEQAPYVVADKLVSYAVTPSDIGKVFTNSAANERVSFSLPAPTVGLHFRFLIANIGRSGFGRGLFGDANFGDGTTGELMIVADPASTICLSPTGSIDSRMVFSKAPYAGLHLVAIAATKWVSICTTGLWNIAPGSFGCGKYGEIPYGQL